MKNKITVINRLVKKVLHHITEEARKVVESIYVGVEEYEGNITDIVDDLVEHEVEIIYAVLHNVNVQIQNNEKEDDSTVRKLFHNKCKQLLLEIVTYVDRLTPAM